MLSVIYADSHLCRVSQIIPYAECPYAECRYAEYRYAGSRGGPKTASQ
jgi:hypothetical protein